LSAWQQAESSRDSRSQGFSVQNMHKYFYPKNNQTLAELMNEHKWVVGEPFFLWQNQVFLFFFFVCLFVCVFVRLFACLLACLLLYKLSLLSLLLLLLLLVVSFSPIV